MTHNVTAARRPCVGLDSDAWTVRAATPDDSRLTGGVPGHQLHVVKEVPAQDAETPCRWRRSRDRLERPAAAGHLHPRVSRNPRTSAPRLRAAENLAPLSGRPRQSAGEVSLLAACSPQITLHGNYRRKEAQKRPCETQPDADTPVKARERRRRVGQRRQVETAEDS